MSSIRMTMPRKVGEYRFKYKICSDYQPAFFELDPGKRTLRADYSGEIGNAVPAAVYCGRLLRFSFPPEAKMKDVRCVMKNIAPLCAELCDGYELDWNGSYMTGRYDNDLRDQIESAVYYGLGEIYD